MNKFLSLVFSALILTGCATTQHTPPKDLSAYKSHMPKSILVLPPINNSPDVKATYGYWSTVAVPVAEAGYYVFPLSIVDQLFKENGITNGNDAQSIPTQKLREIFGADAGLYTQIKEYGTQYKVIDSVSTVSVEAKLVDLKTGTVLWTGQESVRKATSENNSGLIAMVVSAVVNQITSSLNDHAHPLSMNVNNQLFTPTQDQQHGLLVGPRSPKFQQ